MSISFLLLNLDCWPFHFENSWRLTCCVVLQQKCFQRGHRNQRLRTDFPFDELLDAEQIVNGPGRHVQVHGRLRFGVQSRFRPEVELERVAHSEPLRAWIRYLRTVLSLTRMPIRLNRSTISTEERLGSSLSQALAMATRSVFSSCFCWLCSLGVSS